MQDINQNLTTLTHGMQVWRRQKVLAYQARIRAGAALEDGPTQDITAVLQVADQAIAHALAAWQELAWERYRTVTGIDQTPAGGRHRCGDGMWDGGGGLILRERTAVGETFRQP